jgi:hypothetical protein
VAKFVKGDVVVVPFPFSDLTQAKRRPALIISNLSEIENDVLYLPASVDSRMLKDLQLNPMSFFNLQPLATRYGQKGKNQKNGKAEPL